MELVFPRRRVTSSRLDLVTHQALDCSNHSKTHQNDIRPRLTARPLTFQHILPRTRKYPTNIASNNSLFLYILGAAKDARPTFLAARPMLESLQDGPPDLHLHRLPEALLPFVQESGESLPIVAQQRVPLLQHQHGPPALLLPRPVAGDQMLLLKLIPEGLEAVVPDRRFRLQLQPLPRSAIRTDPGQPVLLPDQQLLGPEGRTDG